jgi:hypothetical protein
MLFTGVYDKSQRKLRNSEQVVADVRNKTLLICTQ